MRAYALILVLLLVIPNAYSYSENIFDGWALPNAKVATSKNLNFTIAPNDDGSKIVFDSNLGDAIVDKGECRSANYLSICYTDVAFSHYNYSLASRTVNKYQIKVDIEVVKLNFTRSFGKLNPEVGEQVNVVSIFQNIGNIPADIYFYDNYSDSFEVFLLNPDCELSNGIVSWKGIIKSPGTAYCSYIIKPKSKISFSSTAYVKYESSGMKEEKNTATISVSDSALNSTNIVPESVKLGDEAKLEFRAKALQNLSSVYYEIVFPKWLPVLSYNSSKGWAISGSTFYYSGKLSQNDEALLQVKVRAQGSGLQEIRENAKFSRDNFQGSYSNALKTNIFHTPPYLRLSNSKFNSSEGELNFFVVNPFELAIQNATLSLSSDMGLSDNEFSFPEIPAGGHSDFKVSFNNLRQNSTISWKVGYSTKFGANASAGNSSLIEFGNGSALIAEQEIPEIKAASNDTITVARQDAEKAENKSQIVVNLQENKKSVPVIVIIAPIALIFALVIAFVLIKRRR